MPCCKVGYIYQRYGLAARTSQYESIDAQLLARWKGSLDGRANGYRTLTEWFNKRLLKHVYDEHSRETIGNRVESDYEILRGDDEVLKEEVMDGLREDGINADRLVNDMISWSTMRSHLKTCLDEEKSIEKETTQWEEESVAIATDIAADKVSDALRSLDTKRVLPRAREAGIEVQVLVICPDCPTRAPFNIVVDRGYICKDHQPAHQSDNT